MPILRSFFVLLACFSLAFSASGQQPTVLEVLGGENVFTRPPLETREDLQRLFREREEDLRTVLRLGGWPGDPDLLFRAVAAGEFDETDVLPGSPLQWMAFRTAAGPNVQRNVLWKGTEPIDAFGLEVRDAESRWVFSIPKICGNLALVARRGLCELSVSLGSGSLDLTDADGRPIVAGPGGVGTITADCPDPDQAAAPTNRTATNLVVEEGVVEFLDPSHPIKVMVEADYSLRAQLDDEGKLAVEIPADAPGSLPIQIGDARGTIGPGTSLFTNWSRPTCGLTLPASTGLVGEEFVLDASGSSVSHGTVAAVELQILQPDGSRRSLRAETATGLVVRERFSLPGTYRVRAYAISERGRRSEKACSGTFKLQPATRIRSGSFTAEWRPATVGRRRGKAWSGVSMTYAPEVQESAVILRWVAIGGGEGLRFNIYRTTFGRDAEKVNTSPIGPDLKGEEGSAFVFEDQWAEQGRHRYRLESVDAHGTAMSHGAFVDIEVSGFGGDGE